MPRGRCSTNSPSYVEISDRSKGSDGDVAEIFSPIKRSTRTRNNQSNEVSARPVRSTRVTKIMRDSGSDVEFVGESPAPSRRVSSQPSPASIPAKRTKPGPTFLGVYIPKLRPSQEMIREFRDKQAAAALAAANDDDVASSVQRDRSAILQLESSVEDEDEIDNDLYAALKRSTVSNGGTRGPTPAKSRPSKKTTRRSLKSDSTDDDVSHRKRKGKQRRRHSDSGELPRCKATVSRRRDLEDSESDVALRRKREKDGERRRKRRRDSDDDTQDEGLDEIELDEPERFKTKSRLRKVKKNAFQERLGSLQKKRRGKVFGAKTESSSEEESSSDTDNDRRRRRAGPSKNRKSTSQWKYVQDDLSDFIASDDDIDGAPVPRGRGRGRDHVDLEAFTFKRETPEYKFKVVFRYLLVLVIQGPGALLPLNGKNDQYYGRFLRNLRDQMSGIKSSISSVLWRSEFVKVLKKYPQWRQARLEEEEDHCEACNRSKQACRHEAWLRGSPYHPEKHEDVYDIERAEQLSAQRRRRRKYKKLGKEYSSDSDDLREIGALGATCLTRTNLWHELHHWEHRLYTDVRQYYHDLLRAKDDAVETDSDSLLSAASDATAGAKADLKRRRAISQRRVADLKTRRLPRDAEDIDEVTEWMDRQGYQKDAMRYLTRLVDRARDLDSVRR
ncbi:hypothetical protein CcaverHIS002_0602690 [Cutaneotrichosporon cavernicola]|uniref:DUF4211 domain-containing protein n=1 Tax=Cutaneotrichosporon cavernicola TaxID=279322 RepID=A0AA48L874_9TREE|nr:uncharacterized protein CcaverHIS019_0602170 [Cutaneotrichosporon cavernicola]BEI85982.1 hypothetical protein CcaverHIS002_0602690 [Cutaneotrichosporon cavernicola]BEI93758.1 hypothetical protein CcaverHIS019_0602170 [Cutaneotrichosporon cavernicola]BEJ01536.1 hypothetical protein CcaverHIS631_0602180 [Cutaneotrichosporon cavernicola]BEJ09300.1 hypothetical protein CcaverHIS641_0602150 [Cutaneotrichosporon cavernicola]